MGAQQPESATEAIRMIATTKHIEETLYHNQLVPSADSVRERGRPGTPAAAQSAPRGAIFATVVNRVREYQVCEMGVSEVVCEARWE